MTFRIGDWAFDPSSNELRNGLLVRRLEPRAGRILMLMIEHRGQVVSHEQILARVWDGRQLSANSVATAISQLRQTIGDDARRSRFIETVPKRGYRLNPLIEATVAPLRRPFLRRFAAVVVACSVAALLYLAYANQRPTHPIVGFTSLEDQTGNPAYAPLAAASSQLIIAGLSQRAIAVHPGRVESGLTIHAKMVLWNGSPSISLSATDPQGIVRWSGMTRGGAAAMPSEVDRNLNEFSSRLPRR